MAFNRNAGGHTFDFDTTAVRVIAACILALTLVVLAGRRRSCFCSIARVYAGRELLHQRYLRNARTI